MFAQKDKLLRPLQDLRISVTDRCNFRCSYCMPNIQYDWVARKEILTFEEITRLTKLFVQLGVEKIRLTGGEPLLRREIAKLVKQISDIAGVTDLSLTTNGFLLSELANDLKTAGLKRLNVSLDTLDPEKFKLITQKGDVRKVLKGLAAAKSAGFSKIKINTVVMRGINENEILELVRFSRENGFFIRFIEYMDVGNSNQWSLEQFVSKQEILEKIREYFPLKEILRDNTKEPAVEYEFADGKGELGIIASVTEPFCSDCVRARLTADGKLVTCLFSETGHDLKKMMRNGADDEEIRKFIGAVWQRRRDRFSEERRDAMLTNSYNAKTHQKIEMITLGG